MSWVLANSGNVVNLDNAEALVVVQSGTDWVIDVWYPIDQNIARLNGIWPTADAAKTVAARLVGSIDPATYGD